MVEIWLNSSEMGLDSLYGGRSMEFGESVVYG